MNQYCGFGKCKWNYITYIIQYIQWSWKLKKRRSISSSYFKSYNQNIWKHCSNYAVITWAPLSAVHNSIGVKVCDNLKEAYRGMLSLLVNFLVLVSYFLHLFNTTKQKQRIVEVSRTVDMFTSRTVSLFLWQRTKYDWGTILWVKEHKNGRGMNIWRRKVQWKTL